MRERKAIRPGAVLLVLAAVLVSGCGGAPLHDAARRGDIHAVEHLLDAGADIEERCSPNLYVAESPLAAAALNGHTKVVSLLLDRGADINARTSTGGTALIYAAPHGQTNTVRLFLDRGADLELRDNWGLTALDRTKKYCPKLSHPENCPQVIALLQGAAMKKALHSAMETKQKNAEAEQERIRTALASADLSRLLEMQPENGTWAVALTEALIRAKSTELPGFLANSTVQERVALLTAVELRLSQAQVLTARLNAIAEDSVREGQSAVPFREEAGKVQVYTGVLTAIRSMLLAS